MANQEEIIEKRNKEYEDRIESMLRDHTHSLSYINETNQKLSEEKKRLNKYIIENHP